MTNDRKVGLLNKKGLAALLSVLLSLLMLLNATGTVYAAEIKACGDPDANPPAIDAKSAVLYSMDLDKTVYKKDENTKLPPYSITKLVTVVLAAEKLDLNKTVKISAAAADDIADGSTMNLIEGEKISVKDLIYGAMVVSGNDAAYALAEAVSGSEKEFVKLMNSTVKEWGCKNTNFTNPMGLDEEEHYSSAADILIITQHAIANETVHKAMTSRKYTVPATNKSDARELKSHITLIKKEDSGVIGGKTGFWDKQHATVTLEYNKDQLSAILVLLGDTAKGRVRDAKSMLKFSHKVVPGFRVVKEGEELEKVWVKHGSKTRVMTKAVNTLHAYPANNRKGAIKTRFVQTEKKLEAPVKEGTKVGRYEVYIKDKLIAQTDAVIAEDVTLGWLPSNLYVSNAIFLVIIISLLLLLMVIIIFRNSRKSRKRRRIEKNLKQRYKGKH